MAADTRTPILLTGSVGFIGYHVAKQLLSDGHEVVGLDNMNAYYDVQLKEARLSRLLPHQNYTHVTTDIADFDGVQRLFAEIKPQRVIHLAAQAGVRHSLEQPRAYTSANIEGFLSVLEGCRHHSVRHLIYASSSSVYGANAKVPFSEHDGVDHPVSLYAATKRANELMAHSYAHLFALPCTALRFFTVYGPWGRPDMALFLFTKSILEGTPINVFNHGRMRRDFTYIDDISAAVVKLLEKPPQPDPDFSKHNDPAGSAAPHKIFNIGNHTPVELEYFISVIEKELGKTAQKNYLPMQAGDVPATYADVDDLAQAVGFAPKTSIEEGISHFVAWYRDYYGV